MPLELDPTKNYVDRLKKLLKDLQTRQDKLEFMNDKEQRQLYAEEAALHNKINFGEYDSDDELGFLSILISLNEDEMKSLLVQIQEFCRNSTLTKRFYPKLVIFTMSRFNLSYVSMLTDSNALIYSKEYQPANAGYSDRILQELIQEVAEDRMKATDFFTLLESMIQELHPSILTRLFWNNNELIQLINQDQEMRKHVDKVEDLKLYIDGRHPNLDQRIVHLFHVFGGITGVASSDYVIHKKSLINCLTENEYANIAQDFSSKCIYAGYYAHIYCAMIVNRDSKEIKHLHNLQKGDHLLMLDRGSRVFTDDNNFSYCVNNVDPVKQFLFKTMTPHGRIKQDEESVFIAFNTLLQGEHITKEETPEYLNSKPMKKGICAMNQKFWIKVALLETYGEIEGLQQYKKIFTIFRMRQFEKYHLKSDVSLFLDDEIAMIHNIISRINKQYITERHIAETQSISDDMKPVWIAIIQDVNNGKQTKALLTLRAIKKDFERNANDQPTMNTVEEMNNVDYVIAMLINQQLGFNDISEIMKKRIIDAYLANDLKLTANDRSQLESDNRWIVNNAVSIDGNALYFASDASKNDLEVVMAAVIQNAYALEYASDALKADREVVLAAVKKKGCALGSASETLQADQEVVMESLRQDARAFTYVGRILTDDTNFMKQVVLANYKVLQFAPDLLKRDREVVLAAVNQNGYALQFASKLLQDDREVVLAAVNQNGYALQFASQLLQDDREVVLAAVSQNGYALQFASQLLQNDQEVVLAAVNQNGYALQFASQLLQDQEDVFLAALNQNSYILQLASDELKENKQVVYAAVSQDARALQFAPDLLKRDRELVLAAVSQNGYALEYASQLLQEDREVVLAAVKQNAYAHVFASQLLQEDREVVLAAVNQDINIICTVSESLKANQPFMMSVVCQWGCALRYASQALKNNQEVVMIAVNQDGRALQYASKALQDNREVVMAAVNQDRQALQFASEALQDDLEVVMTAVGEDCDAASLGDDAESNNSLKRPKSP